MSEQPVPDWADGWLDSHCHCGGRCVHLAGWAGEYVIACSVSGYAIGHCPDKEGIAR